MNSTGHMILFQMAYNLLDAQAQKRVTQILSDPNNPEEGGYKTDGRDNGVPDAATYPDVYKEDARKNHLGDPKSNLHFYNSPIGDPQFTKGKTVSSPNGVTQITSQKAILENSKSSADMQADALRWVLHEYGDIGAQPGHVVQFYSAKFPNGDAGGNDEKINWGSSGEFDNELHALMDCGGAHPSPGNPSKSENNYKNLPDPLDASAKAWIEQRALQLQQKYPSSTFGTQVNDQNPMDWIHDLTAQASQIWPKFQKPNEVIKPSDPRLANIQNVMDKNVALAAYRLANYLNALYGTSSAVAQSAAAVPPHAPVHTHQHVPTTSHSPATSHAPLHLLYHKPAAPALAHA